MLVKDIKVIFIDIYGNIITKITMSKEQAFAIGQSFKLGDEVLTILRRVCVLDTMYVESTINKANSETVKGDLRIEGANDV